MKDLSFYVFYFNTFHIGHVIIRSDNDCYTFFLFFFSIWKINCWVSSRSLPNQHNYQWVKKNCIGKQIANGQLEDSFSLVKHMAVFDWQSYGRFWLLMWIAALIYSQINSSDWSVIQLILIGRQMTTFDWSVRWLVLIGQLDG